MLRCRFLYFSRIKTISYEVGSNIRNTSKGVSFFSVDVIRLSSIFFRNTIINQTDNILLKQHRLYLNNGHSQGDSTH